MRSSPMQAYYHADSNSIRFWVRVRELPVGASIPCRLLYAHFQPDHSEGDGMQLFAAHADELAEAVRRRVEGGSIEPVMLRERDLTPPL